MGMTNQFPKIFRGLRVAPFRSSVSALFFVCLALCASLLGGCAQLGPGSGFSSNDELKSAYLLAVDSYLAGQYEKSASIFQRLSGTTVDPVLARKAYYGLACSRLVVARTPEELHDGLTLWNTWVQMTPEGLPSEDPRLITPLLPRLSPSHSPSSPAMLTEVEIDHELAKTKRLAGCQDETGKLKESLRKKRLRRKTCAASLTPWSVCTRKSAKKRKAWNRPQPMDTSKANANEHGSATILVVDDDKNILQVLEARLASAKYRTLTAKSAEEAVELLARNPVDLVVSDVKMPGMGGVGLLNEVLEQWPQVPVILLTAYGSIPDAVSTIRSGAADYLTKPFDGQQLLQKISTLLGRAAQEPAAKPGGKPRNAADGHPVGRSQPGHARFLRHFGTRGPHRCQRAAAG